MTVVVTGAAGFIGTHLVRRLAARGERVIALDRRHGAPPDAAEHVVTDLVDAPDDLLAELLRGASAVFHLAALPGVRDGRAAAGGGPGVDGRADLDRRRWRDNVLAAERVLAWVPLGVPLVVASSSSVYGDAGDGDGGARPSRETDPLRPRGGYARSKVALEERCGARAAAGGTVAVVRPFTVAGEGQRPDMAVARWLAAASAGERLRVHGSLDRRRDVTDVTDVVEGLVRAADRAVTGPVNLGTGVGHTLAELVDAVSAALGVAASVTVVPAEPAEPAATLADTTRCRRWLGLEPRTDLAALVSRQAAAVPACLTAAAS